MQHPAIDRLQAMTQPTFTPARRGGYDIGEVDQYLQRIASLVGEVASIEPEPVVVVEPQASEPTDEVIRVLELAEAAGAEVIADARDEAASITAKAKADADKLRADTVHDLQAARRDLERLREAAGETRNGVDRQLRESAAAAKSILGQAMATLDQVRFDPVNLPDLPVTETVLDRMAMSANDIAPDVAEPEPEPEPEEIVELGDVEDAELVSSDTTAEPVVEAAQPATKQNSAGDADFELTLPPLGGIDTDPADLDDKFSKFWSADSGPAEKWRLSPSDD